MNIFILDRNPYLAARMLCDKHIEKMPLKSTQLLCTYLRSKFGEAECDWQRLYRATHRRHPCQLWLQQSSANVAWLRAHTAELFAEYSRRYDKRHASEAPFDSCVRMLFGQLILPHYEVTSFVQYMPEKYRSTDGDAVAAYRRYYIAEKLRFAKWERGTPQPDWVNI